MLQNYPIGIINFDDFHSFEMKNNEGFPDEEIKSQLMKHPNSYFQLVLDSGEPFGLLTLFNGELTLIYCPFL